MFFCSLSQRLSNVWADASMVLLKFLVLSLWCLMNMLAVHVTPIFVWFVVLKEGGRGRNWPSLYFCVCCFFDIKILILCTYELTSVYAFTLKHVIFLTQNWSSISFSVYHDFIDYSNIYSLEPWHNTNIDDIFIGHFFRSLFSSFNLLSTSLFRLEVVWTNATLHYRRSLHV